MGKEIKLEEDECNELKALVIRTLGKISWVLDNSSPKNRDELLRRTEVLNKIKEKLE